MWLKKWKKCQEKKLRFGLFHKDPVSSTPGPTLFSWKSYTNVLVPGFSKNPKYSKFSILSDFHFCHLIGWDRSRRKNHIILLFLFACVVISMRSVPLKFRYLKTWFPVGDAVWGGGTVLLEDVHHWLWAVRVHSSGPLPVHSLFCACQWRCRLSVAVWSCLHACCFLSTLPHHDRILLPIRIKGQDKFSLQAA